MTPQLVAATPDDIGVIMQLERGRGFGRWVGRWSDQEHGIEFANPGSVYLLWRRDADILGFSLLQGVGSVHRSTRLRRIAVREPGKGTGSALLRATLAHCFTQTDTHRLDLMVFTDNVRARRSYQRAGFIDEGVLRDVHRSDAGVFRSMWMMSILRREWEAAVGA